jgi:hypothetical protein
LRIKLNMPTRIEKLTPEQESQMIPYANKWIEIGLRTGEADWKTFDEYMPKAYEKAGIPYPKNVVRVSSPLVGAFAASIAEQVWKKRGAVGETVRKADLSIGEIVDDADEVVGRAIDNAVDNAVCDTVDETVGATVGKAVVSIDRTVRDVVDEIVDDASRIVGEAIVEIIGDAIDVDMTVENVVGATVGATVENSVSAIDDAIVEAVNMAVIEEVLKTADNTSIIEDVKKTMQLYDVKNISWHYWLGGQFWVGGWYYGNAFVNFFIDVCGLILDKDIMERALIYRKINESVNYIWANRNFVIVCDRPKEIHRDNQGQLHNEKGMSIKYGDGWGVYHLHGVSFEKELFDKVISGQMSVQEIVLIQDTDQRIQAMEIVLKNK